MTFTWFAGADAVDAFGGAGAGKRSIMGSAFALDMVVSCAVGVATQRAYDRTFANRAFRDRMVKRVASIASTKNRERDIFLNSGGGSKEGRRVANELLDSGPIGIDEGDRNG